MEDDKTVYLSDFETAQYGAGNIHWAIGTKLYIP